MMPHAVSDDIASIDALLFDLGRVVLDFDIHRTAAAWAEASGCTPADMVARFVRDETFWRYETGQLSDAEFFELLRQSLGVKLSDTKLLAGWNHTFIGEMPGITPLLARAAARWPLYAFSNTNTAHVAYFSQHYAEPMSHFREIFLSSTIQLRKPHAEAYQHVIAAIGVPADRILFFDDLAENIEGARACGLRAIQVTSPTTVAETLKAIGL